MQQPHTVLPCPALRDVVVCPRPGTPVIHWIQWRSGRAVDLRNRHPAGKKAGENDEARPANASDDAKDGPCLSARTLILPHEQSVAPRQAGIDAAFHHDNFASGLM